MKKILAVIGSPRKNGNTEIIVNRLSEGAATKGAQVETVWLSNLTIRQCDGCHVCWKGKPCCKHDDMLGLYTKIIESDVIVFATPVYWYGPTALMKAFIDRLVYFNCPENRAKIKGKEVALVIPFEDENLDTAKPLVEFFENCMKYLELTIAGAIIVGGVGEKGDVLKKPLRLEEAYKLGRRLA